MIDVVVTTDATFRSAAQVEFVITYISAHLSSPPYPTATYSRTCGRRFHASRKIDIRPPEIDGIYKLVRAIRLLN